MASVLPYGMTSREFNFCLKYLESGFNFDEAIDYAYNYSKSTKEQLGYKLFNRPKIKAYLTEHIKIIMEKTDLNAAKVIKLVSDIAEDKKNKPFERLKAAELLLKHLESEEKKKANALPEGPRQKALANLSPDEVRQEYWKTHNKKLAPMPTELNIDDLYGKTDEENTQDIEADLDEPGADV